MPLAKSGTPALRPQLSDYRYHKKVMHSYQNGFQFNPGRLRTEKYLTCAKSLPSQFIQILNFKSVKLIIYSASSIQ